MNDKGLGAFALDAVINELKNRFLSIQQHTHVLSLTFVTILQVSVTRAQPYVFVGAGSTLQGDYLRGVGVNVRDSQGGSKSAAGVVDPSLHS
jgi:hypothetical protein